MGAGGHLRWVEHPQLRAMMNELIDGIENCTEGDGYLAAYPQAKLATDEHPGAWRVPPPLCVGGGGGGVGARPGSPPPSLPADYTTSWTVHGFLEAAIAGNTKALRMIRAHMNVFNNHTLLPTFLPPGA